MKFIKPRENPLKINRQQVIKHNSVRSVKAD
jgi:hypothetical protein